MNQIQTVKQMLELNKKIFDGAFDAVSFLQDKTESFVSRYMERSTWITPEGKNIFSRLCDTYRKGRSDLRAMADENYKKTFEHFAAANKQLKI